MSDESALVAERVHMDGDDRYVVSVWRLPRARGYAIALDWETESIDDYDGTRVPTTHHLHSALAETPEAAIARANALCHASGLPADIVAGLTPLIIPARPDGRPAVAPTTLGEALFD